MRFQTIPRHPQSAGSKQDLNETKLLGQTSIEHYSGTSTKWENFSNVSLQIQNKAACLVRVGAWSVQGFFIVLWLNVLSTTVKINQTLFANEILPNVSL